MRRLAVTAIVLAAAVVAAMGSLGASDGEDAPHYNVVLDNAFGLIEGADVKVAGVRAGRVEKLDVRPSDLRALVTISITRTGFGSFRTDVFCEVRPQSLIGEYFLDCQPGRNETVLRSGSTIPVTQTATTIPADLVANILRRPYRDRLRLILNELGVGLAARGPDLNATIRRAVPALRETNRVLAILDKNRSVLQQLTRDADHVLVRLAANRQNLTRFVAEARDTAAVSASRRVALRATFRKLPTFLRELRPTLRDLGTAASEQVPALRDLRASAPQLTTFLQRLGPFSKASTPAISSLGDASDQGRQLADHAPPLVEQLRNFAGPTPEVSRNLSIVLQHLDDRNEAVENDPDSPGGRGYTGLEALLQYLFDQVQSLNIFDKRGYMLKINLILSTCGSYTDAEHAIADPERTERCSSALGPSQPGVNQPDPSPGGAISQTSASRSSRRPASTPAASGDAGGSGEDRERGSRRRARRDRRDDTRALAALLRSAPPAVRRQFAPASGEAATETALLDFLLAR